MKERTQGSAGVLPATSSRLRNIFTGGFDRAARSNTSVRCRPVLEIPDDAKRRKKVRFYDANVVHAFNKKPNDSRRNCITDDPNFVPKTAELSSYKKLLEEAGCKMHSRQQLQEAVKPTRVAVSDSIKVTEDTLTGTCELSKPLLLEGLTPLGHTEFPASNVILEDREKCRSVCLFSDKRCKIIKAVANNMALEVDDFASIGLDIIPQFMQRLGIENRSNNHDKIPMPFQTHGHDLTYLQVQSCAIPRVLSGDGAPIFSIFQEKGTFLDHVYDANHCLMPLNNRDTHEIILNAADSFAENGRMELVTGMKCDIDTVSSRNSPFNMHPANATSFSKFEFFSPEILFPKYHRLELPFVPGQSSQINELDRALAPYSYSRPWDLNEPYYPYEHTFTKDKCMNLLEWEEKPILSGTPSSGSDILSEDENHISLTLYRDPTSLGFDWKPVQCFDVQNIVETKFSLDDALLLPSCSSSFSGFTDPSIDSFGFQCLITFPDLQDHEKVTSSYCGKEFVRCITDEDEFQTLLRD